MPKLCTVADGAYGVAATITGIDYGGRTRRVSVYAYADSSWADRHEGAHGDRTTHRKRFDTQVCAFLRYATVHHSAFDVRLL